MQVPNETVAIPPRINILGVGVHAVNLDRAGTILLAAAARRQRGYVCVRDVNGIMASVKDPALRRIHNRSLLTVPDGMPNVWVGRLRGYRDIGRVYGPDLMLTICRRGVPLGATHYLYGGVPGIAGRLADRLRDRVPGIRIVGTGTPPFRPLTDEETGALQRAVAAVRPDFFWVGISTPKQERFMATHAPGLDATILLGVGAAFDIHAGIRRDAPDWVKRSGLQWLHRLGQEPRRLGRRYLLHNPTFLFHLALQITGLRKYPMDPPD